jgi:hypothetical protein
MKTLNELNQEIISLRTKINSVMTDVLKYGEQKELASILYMLTSFYVGTRHIGDHTYTDAKYEYLTLQDVWYKILPIISEECTEF